VIWPNYTAFNIDLFSLFSLLEAILVILFLLIFVIFSSNLQNPQEPVIIGEQQLIKMMVIEGVDNLARALMILIELKGFGSCVLIEEFRIKFDEPFCPAITVKRN
jgi:hypothetical protein